MRRTRNMRELELAWSSKLIAMVVAITFVAAGCFGDDEASDPPSTPEPGVVESDGSSTSPPTAAPTEVEDPGTDPTGTDDDGEDEGETHGPGVIPDEFALDGEPVAWRAATTAVSAMFADVYNGSGLEVLSVAGDVILTTGGGLMSIDYNAVTINFATGAAIPNVVINGQLIGGVVSDGTVVSFTGEDGGLQGTSTVLGSEIIVPIDAADLPLGTTNFVFEFDTSGDRLVIHPADDAGNTVWFPSVWLRVYD